MMVNNRYLFRRVQNIKEQVNFKHPLSSISSILSFVSIANAMLVISLLIEDDHFMLIELLIYSYIKRFTATFKQNVHASLVV